MIDLPARRVAAAVLAHPDDAEILCAGTLVRLADAGWEVHIVTATAGDCGSSTLTPEQISGIRKAEARRAVEIIGGHYHCIDELDVRVVYDKPTIQKLIDLMRQISPTLVFSHAPKDYIIDHEMVSLLARNATFSYPMPNASSIPLARDSAVPYLYYCDPLEGNNPYGRPVEPTTLIDITEVMPRKVQMLECHTSQREWLRAHHGMDEYIDSMKRHGQSQGRLCDVSYAEAFIQHRGHGYPGDDLLAELFDGGV